jgi:hypothetical protein
LMWEAFSAMRATHGVLGELTGMSDFHFERGNETKQEMA